MSKINSSYNFIKRQDFTLSIRKNKINKIINSFKKKDNLNVKYYSLKNLNLKDISLIYLELIYKNTLEINENEIDKAIRIISNLLFEINSDPNKRNQDINNLIFSIAYLLDLYSFQRKIETANELSLISSLILYLKKYCISYQFNEDDLIIYRQIISILTNFLYYNDIKNNEISHFLNGEITELINIFENILKLDCNIENLFFEFFYNIYKTIKIKIGDLIDIIILFFRIKNYCELDDYIKDNNFILIDNHINNFELIEKIISFSNEVFLNDEDLFDELNSVYYYKFINVIGRLCLLYRIYISNNIELLQNQSIEYRIYLFLLSSISIFSNNFDFNENENNAYELFNCGIYDVILNSINTANRNHIDENNIINNLIAILSTSGSNIEDYLFVEKVLVYFNYQISKLLYTQQQNILNGSDIIITLYNFTINYDRKKTELLFNSNYNIILSLIQLGKDNICFNKKTLKEKDVLIIINIFENLLQSNEFLRIFLLLQNNNNQLLNFIFDFLSSSQINNGRYIYIKTINFLNFIIINLKSITNQNDQIILYLKEKNIEYYLNIIEQSEIDKRKYQMSYLLKEENDDNINSINYLRSLLNN